MSSKNKKQILTKEKKLYSILFLINHNIIKQKNKKKEKPKFIKFVRNIICYEN